jgi:hypothetical protein
MLIFAHKVSLEDAKEIVAAIRAQARRVLRRSARAETSATPPGQLELELRDTPVSTPADIARRTGFLARLAMLFRRPAPEHETRQS